MMRYDILVYDWHQCIINASFLDELFIYLDFMMHVYIGEMGHHWFRKCCWTPIHHVIQRRRITAKIIGPRTFNQNCVKYQMLLFRKMLLKFFRPGVEVGSVCKCRLSSLWIHHIKMRWSHDRLAYIMRIPIPRKMVFCLKWGIVELLLSLYGGRRVNLLRPRQNGRHFPDDIFKYIFLNGNV